jgi:hypothetical protein
VYYYIIGALKRRIINELKDSFSRHPIYSKIVPYIQNKYSFNERPQYGIIVKGSSANKISLAGDNFMGTVESHVGLFYFGTPAHPIEWVREDQAVLANNQEQMPILPGVYYIEILSVPKNASEPGMYTIDPLITVPQEPLLFFQTGIETEGQLQNPPSKGTLRIYENGNWLLTEGTDYVVNYSTGAIVFKTRFKPGARVMAEYRYSVPSLGPIPFFWNVSDFKTLPGVVMAFGKRARVGDKCAVVVYPDRVDVARAYGGKWEVSFELEAVAQDPIQMEEISDLAMMYLWADKKPYLENEGIEIVDLSMGGESEEPMDETGDIYMYSASLSLQLRADWEVHAPMPFTISRVRQTNAAGQPADPNTPSDQVAPLASGASPLIYPSLPIFNGRNNDFERIR